MIGWALDTISQELMWMIVVIAVIAAIAVVSFLKK
jgi:Tfp pilus assembly protein FimT